MGSFSKTVFSFGFFRETDFDEILLRLIFAVSNKLTSDLQLKRLYLTILC